MDDPRSPQLRLAVRSGRCDSLMADRAFKCVIRVGWEGALVQSVRTCDVITSRPDHRRRNQITTSGGSRRMLYWPPASGVGGSGHHLIASVRAEMILRYRALCAMLVSWSEYGQK